MRALKREALFAAAEKNLQTIQARVAAGKLADAIGVRVGRVINQYKVSKHFALAIDELASTSLGEKTGALRCSCRRLLSRLAQWRVEPHSGPERASAGR